ncbi:MAG: class I SAM-dependent methyltransferase [Acidobacteriales bacterium]|nr:class I SAM-dependent methyltransferase [Terriglobales bacterium]
MRRYWAPLSIVLAVALLGAPLKAQTAASSAAAPARKTSTPYSGDLSIFESSGRDQRLHIERIMQALAITPGKSVADIGAGSGWFSVRAARQVGSSGQVYAVDINREAVAYIEKRSQKEKLSNIKAILSQPGDPMLPPSSVDAVLLLKTYHEISDPVALLRKLVPALRPGALVGIIDRDGNGEDHGINKDVVIHEAGEAGLSLASEYDFVKDDGMDYFLVLKQK